MKDSDRNRTRPGAPEAHWAHKNPAGQPPREAVVGLPRMVLEARARIGPEATPSGVARELQDRGVDTNVDSVRDVWDEGHAEG